MNKIIKLALFMRIISGKYRGKKLSTPLHGGTRPTSDRTRETIFNILLHNPGLGPQTMVDKRVLDVFAGTGALGLEALSRGAKSVTFIENDPDCLVVLHANIKSFGIPSEWVLEKDARHLIKHSENPFELVFLDPPYHQNLVLPTLEKLFDQSFLGKGTVVTIEIAKDEFFLLPSYLTLITERTSGAAKVLFCTISF